MVSRSAIAIHRRSRHEVALCGELDAYACAVVQQVLADARIRVIDLAAVTFIDRAGLTALTPAGRALSLVRIPTSVSRLIALLSTPSAAA